MKKKYELMFIVSANNNEENVNRITAKVEQAIIASGAEDITKDVIGVKELAYPIRKEKRGFYFLFRFESSGIKNIEIEKKLNIDEEIYRYLLIKDEKEKLMKKIRIREERKEANRAARRAKDMQQSEKAEKKARTEERALNSDKHEVKQLLNKEKIDEQVENDLTQDYKIEEVKEVKEEKEVKEVKVVKSKADKPIEEVSEKVTKFEKEEKSDKVAKAKVEKPAEEEKVKAVKVLKEKINKDSEEAKPKKRVLKLKK